MTRPLPRRTAVLVLAPLVLFVPLFAATAGRTSAQSSDRVLLHAHDQDSQRSARVALVIGNAAYETAPLSNPVNDARDMAAALRAHGFEVTLGTDWTKRQMEDAIRAFGSRLRAGRVGLFYFAGHGMQVGGRNFLVPIGFRLGTESEVEYEAVDTGRVLGQMEDAGSGVNVVILDACRNNPFGRGFRSVEQGLARLAAPTGSFIGYATAPGSVAADGKGRNGTYTAALLEALRVPGLKVEEVFKRVRQSVARETAQKQVPWDSSSLVGDFYFVGPDALAPTDLAPAAPESTTVEQEYWEAIKNSANADEFEAYLAEYPAGRFVSLARLRVRQLRTVGPSATKPMAEAHAPDGSSAVPRRGRGMVDRVAVRESMRRARDYFASNRDAEALVVLAGVLSQVPDDAEAHLLRGRVYERAGDYDLAIADLEIATSRDPKQTMAYVTLGRIYVARDDCAGAQTALAKAFQLDSASKGVLALRRSVSEKCHRKSLVR